MKIECPYSDCSQRIEIDISFAGSEANCPGCGRPFQCPDKSQFPNQGDLLSKRTGPAVKQDTIGAQDFFVTTSQGVLGCSIQEMRDGLINGSIKLDDKVRHESQSVATTIRGAFSREHPELFELVEPLTFRINRWVLPCFIWGVLISIVLRTDAALFAEERLLRNVAVNLMVCATIMPFFPKLGKLGVIVTMVFFYSHVPQDKRLEYIIGGVILAFAKGLPGFFVGGLLGVLAGYTDWALTEKKIPRIPKQ